MPKLRIAHVLLIWVVVVFLHDCLKPSGVPKEPTPCRDSYLINGDNIPVYECHPGAQLVVDEDGPSCICPRGGHE